MTTTIPFTVSPNRAALGEAAAAAIADALRKRLASSGRVTVALAAAPSQNETLAALAAAPGIDWSRVTAFHIDEYVGVRPDAPFSFRRYLDEHILSLVKPGAFHGVGGEAADLAAECARYAALLEKNPPEIGLIGIGENGHLAFNDPPADFSDPAVIKVVDLAESCRVQQVHDGAFRNLDEVPRQALTLTIPALLRIPQLFAMVPGQAKAEAVRAAIMGPLSPLCPASIVRTHPNVHLYLDQDSASLLPPQS